VKLRIAPMLGIKWFSAAAIILAGIELLRRIYKGQFNLGGLRLKDRSTPAVWNAVLGA
jgi:transposase-like protein